MPTSLKITGQIGDASWIRRMFEEGARLKQLHGEDNVFDFTLGNPVIEPPPRLQQVLEQVVLSPRPGMHRYMPNAGHEWVRAAVAAHLSRVHAVRLGAEHVLMTCGAAGALNCVLKAILDPGDEVLVLVPFFPEYAFYIDNHGGRMVLVETDERFGLDVDAVRRAIGPRTRAMIVNSPNNPTGRVYDRPSMEALGDVLRRAEEEVTGRPLYLLSDEPYRAIVYDAVEVPSIFAMHRHCVLCTSHSKDLGLAGERIGYAAINPAHLGADKLFGALAFANRILGYVNAPALMQLVVAELQEERIDPLLYRRRRDMFVQGLGEAGWPVEAPQGAFYLFPATPIPDDLAFANRLKEKNVLVVPGRGFGRPGHVRICYCVPEEVIARSLTSFRAALQELS
ncbi:MAG: pyridoxal phosphate-dependent aminotransferase [Deltaproteobacteria bacterium]|nr:pyridoxal phosphate-dependent aminotransferase [Deltaproteobacteria bacterium]